MIENQRLHLIDDTCNNILFILELILDFDCITFNAPLTDTFILKVRYKFLIVNEGVELNIHNKMDFVKSTIFKSKLESAT